MEKSIIWRKCETYVDVVWKCETHIEVEAYVEVHNRPVLRDGPERDIIIPTMAGIVSFNNDVESPGYPLCPGNNNDESTTHEKSISAGPEKNAITRLSRTAGDD